jgi:hypothetical protein
MELIRNHAPLSPITQVSSSFFSRYTPRDLIFSSRAHARLPSSIHARLLCRGLLLPLFHWDTLTRAYLRLGSPRSVLRAAACMLAHSAAPDRYTVPSPQGQACACSFTPPPSSVASRATRSLSPGTRVVKRHHKQPLASRRVRRGTVLVSGAEEEGCHGAG